MNSDGSPRRSGNMKNVNRRRTADCGLDPRSAYVSPDRDIDLRRRFEALKGDLTVATGNADSAGGDGQQQKLPLTLADIQGSIAKKHSSDLAMAQRKWIESLNLKSPGDSGHSEEDAQKEWINHISVSKISDRPSRRDDGARRSSENRTGLTSPKSSSTTSPHKVPRNLTVRSTVLTPGAPTFGFCDVPHLTINSLPVTATSVKDVLKPDREFVTESGKIIKMLKLEEPPKNEKKHKGRSPQKMKAVINLDPSKNEVVRYVENGFVITVKSSFSSKDLQGILRDVKGITVQIDNKGRTKQPKELLKPNRSQRTSLSPKKSKNTESPNSHIANSLSPEVVEKYKLAFNRGAVFGIGKDSVGKSARSKSEHKSPKKLKRSSSLPGGLFKEKPENEPTKPVRNYDVKETRFFIKQKQKERDERMAEEKRKKAIEAEERKAKMLQLRETQRKIMQKIKKRTVNKIRSPLVIKKDPEKPKWIGPAESMTASALDTSFELIPPKPKTPVLSEVAMGTITFRRNKEPAAPPVQQEVAAAESKETETEFVVDPPISTSVATCTRTDETLESDANSPKKTIFKDFCLKDLETPSDPCLLKRSAPQFVESSTQSDLDAEKCLLNNSKHHGRSSVHSYQVHKRPKHSLFQEIVNKENLEAGNDNVLCDVPYSSRFDKFLAEYIPTPKKSDSTTARPQTPPWLQEMSQYPDQFNLINTLNKALKKQQKLDLQAPIPATKGESASAPTAHIPTSVKIHEIGCKLNQASVPNVHSGRSSKASASGNASSSSSIRSEGDLSLEPQEILAVDDNLSSSSIASTSAHSFEHFAKNVTTPYLFRMERNPPPALRNDSSLSLLSGIQPLSESVVTPDANSSDLNFLFPQIINKSSHEGSTKLDSDVKVDSKSNLGEVEILGEKILEPKGVITVRKPLGRRPQKLLDLPSGELSSNLVLDFVNSKRGSDFSDMHRAEAVLSAPSSPDVDHSRMTSFSSMKEGSYLLTHSETKSDDTHRTFEVVPESSYRRFLKNIQVPPSCFSEHSSDSVSEIVKVSRTVSRGSTVISEEVSELQNTVSLSTKSLKFNSSSIQNQIKSEIEQLDRVNDSLSSFMESGKVVLSREVTNTNTIQADTKEEPLSQDVVAIKSKSPIVLDEVDSSLLVSRNVLHSREPSGSSLDLSLASANGVDVTKLTVEMFDNLIKDEKLRSEQLVSGLKVRMKSLCSRTRKDLEFIESQRKKLIETGHEEEARELKRKQRGHIMKMNEEIEEMQRQRAMENKACQERCMLLKQQQQLIKLLLQSRRESSARNCRGSVKSLHMSQLDETVRHVGIERNSDIIDRKKREYREKEDALKERKKNVEAIVAWKKRLELEEKSVREMETMIAQSSFSAQLPAAVERGTSPFTDMKDSVSDEVKAPESRVPACITSQSESEHQNKDYYSDSFEHSSVLSETTGTVAPGMTQGSSLLNKAMKMPMLKVPLAPRVTIIKRRHSSGSDESMLLSQNDTLSEPSDVEVRVSALEQQLRHRKSELAKLKREYQKNQKERLRSTEKNLINQIQLYDSYIEQVKNEIKELENSDVKVTKPQIKQPKFSDRRQSDRFVVKTKSKESFELAVDAKNNESSMASEEVSSHDASVLFLDKAPAGEEKTAESPREKSGDSISEVTEKLEPASDSNDKEVQEEIPSELADFEALSAIEFSGVSTDPVFKAAMEKVKMKSMEPLRDSESSLSEKDYSIEEIIEKAEQSQRADSSEEINLQSNATEASLSELGMDLAKVNKLSAVDEVTGESLTTQSQMSEIPEAPFTDDVLSSKVDNGSVEEDLVSHTQPSTTLVSSKETAEHVSVLEKDNDGSPTDEAMDIMSSSEELSFVNTDVVNTVSELNSVPETSQLNVKRHSESGGSKVSEEISRDNISPSKTSSIETVINTVSEQIKLPSAFSNYLSERTSYSLTEPTMPDKLPDLDADVNGFVVDDVVSPKLTSASASPSLEDNLIQMSPFKSPVQSPEVTPELPHSKAVSSTEEMVQSSEHSATARALSPTEAVSHLASLDGDERVSLENSPSDHVSSGPKTNQEDIAVDESDTHSIVVTGSSPSSPEVHEASFSELGKSSEKISGNSVSSKHSLSKSARKRLDMGDSESFGTKNEGISKLIDFAELNRDKSQSDYQPTMQIEGGKRSISELLSEVITEIKGSSEGSSVSEQIPTDQSPSGVTEEIDNNTSNISEVVGQVEEQSIVSEMSKGDTHDNNTLKDDSELDKLDFSLGSLDPFRPQPVSRVDSSSSVKKDSTQSEAGDNCSIVQVTELSEDKKELGQGDEPLRDLEIQSIEADSLEDPFGQDFNTSFNAEEFAKYFESSFEKEPELNLGPSKPLSDDAVMKLLQNSFELSDKIWEENLSEMKKSSEETPLLSALQRERQQNFNVDSISQMIFDSFVDEATAAALAAYSKKKRACPSENDGGKDKSGELSPIKKVGDNEKLWLGEHFTLQAAREAEQLRLQQLQIEQEIEQLEQAQEVVPYYYVREIPNKPPPPYTPPKPAPPSSEETVSRVLLGGEILWDLDLNGGDPSDAAMPPTFLANLNDEPYRMFMFDLAKELYLKVKPRPSAPVPPWIVAHRRGKPLPPIRCKEDLLKCLEKEIKLAFGFEPRILRESLIMKWTRKRRDHVDEILVGELQESEAQWRDFTVEENMIKNRIADNLIADAIDEAVSGISAAFTNKFNSLSVDQS